MSEAYVRFKTRRLAVREVVPGDVPFVVSLWSDARVMRKFCARNSIITPAKPIKSRMTPMTTVCMASACRASSMESMSRPIKMMRDDPGPSDGSANNGWSGAGTSPLLRPRWMPGGGRVGVNFR